MKVTALAGGIGGARFLRGVKAALPDADVTVIGNTGDDIILHRLNISPDLDTVMYTLGGGISAERGWGREDETFTVAAELAEYGVGPAWFGLGDRDLATHLVRTQMLLAGYSLSDVTAALCQRWRPGVRLIPMSDDRVETHVVITDEQGRRAIHFQEWWLRLRAAVPAEAIVSVGASDAKPAPGVLDALAEADVVLLPPSNPVVSIGSILSVPGIRDAVRETPAPVIGVSPIIGGSPVRGMADACLRAIGVETSAEAVGRHYGARGKDDPGSRGKDGPGARGEGGLLDGWLVDAADAGVTVPGARVSARPLLMTDLDATVAIVRAALELAGV
ncbi:2-phospho-L-lactate transferase [Frankia sp. CNm7]|uniref:2-phospho-L-lactate transferase n=1 Tax=Frankia nepalensis TaxID=1836974 RepID=A0A937UP42_9ACTN|nr:2-phospho-L-lactate transferase [Frankia nepalensis]MBL7496862.1 2-phospho-L-lactate transferase [Frankia nepalensis]MBL7512062.1 2-phospho-L-lactate transferase [Frankia nepalensis]MBL7519430.1 2-phospho-L-lactate transferase [Frankia nepalensis]MBL7630479.1 2-phospho-L-lactate transferase [Frankia nepalensis]